MRKVLGRSATQLARTAALAFALGGAGAAQASFISTTSPPDLFPPGSVITGLGPACVTMGPLSGVCTSNTRTTIDSATISFPGDGNEDVVLDAVVTGDTTDPTGSFSLAGTEDLTIIGRLNAFQVGSFAIDVTSEDFVGSFFGQTVELSLDPTGANDGEVTISDTNRPGAVLIDISLTITHEISVDGGTPTSIGTAHSGVAVPEPSALALLGLPLPALVWVRRRGARGRNAGAASMPLAG